MKKESKLILSRKCQRYTDQTILFFSMKRAGSHAILKYIFNLYDEPKAFFNKRIINKDAVEKKYSIIPAGFYNMEHVNLFLVNYEDPELDIGITGLDRPERLIIPNWEDVIGESNKTKCVLSIRDPFNMVASRMRQSYMGKIWKKRPDIRERVMRRWKVHAREFLGYTNYLSDKIAINYNEWVVSQEHRKYIADRLGVQFRDEGWNVVASEGMGSSFDREKYKNDATQMDLTGRWKSFKNNRLYRSCFKDHEIFELSNAIFGEIEGVESIKEK